MARPVNNSFNCQEERFDPFSLSMIATQQYEAAKKDFGYFLVLIETAVGYYNREGYDIGSMH